MKMEIKFNSGCALFSVYTSKACVHVGVKPYEQEYYKAKKGGGERIVEALWVWGRATEIYDHNGEYFGLGPLLLVCW